MSKLCCRGCTGPRSTFALSAVLAALAFMLHPEQLNRAGAQEHIVISVFMPLPPDRMWSSSRCDTDTERLSTPARSGTRSASSPVASGVNGNSTKIDGEV